MFVEVKTIDGKIYRYDDVEGIETGEDIVKIVIYVKNGVEKAVTFMKHQIVYVYTVPYEYDETEEEK